MHIESLRLRNFRCFGDQGEIITFDPSLTAIVGANGAGKTAIIAALMKLFGSRSDDRPASEARVEKAIRESVKPARHASTQAPMPAAVPKLIEQILAPFGETALRQLAEDYVKPSRLVEMRESITGFLQECALGAVTWSDVIRRFLGSDQVRLMTIHKSKGLEAHTVVFLHLQDDGFNGNAKMDEEALAFFVAASRARERFFVTTTSTNRGRVKPLWDMVAAAHMPDPGQPF